MMSMRDIHCVPAASTTARTTDRTTARTTARTVHCVSACKASAAERWVAKEVPGGDGAVAWATAWKGEKRLGDSARAVLGQC